MQMLNSNIRCIEMTVFAGTLSGMECWIVTLDVLKLLNEYLNGDYTGVE